MILKTLHLFSSNRVDYYSIFFFLLLFKFRCIICASKGQPSSVICSLPSPPWRNFPLKMRDDGPREVKCMSLHCFCIISYSTGAVEANILLAIKTSDRSPCPLLDRWVRAKAMKWHQKSLMHWNKRWWLIYKKSQGSLELICSLTTIMKPGTLLSPERFLNCSFILSHHLILVFLDISSLWWKWSRRLCSLSLLFYCHHLSCNSQEGSPKWMPLYSV